VYQSIPALEDHPIVLITAYQPTLLLFQVHLKTVNLVDAPIRVALVVPYPLLDRIIRSLGARFPLGYLQCSWKNRFI